MFSISKVPTENKMPVWGHQNWDHSLNFKPRRMCIYLIRCQWWTILNKLDFFLISFFELLPWTLFLTHFSVSIKVSSETKAKCQRKTITYSFYLFRMNLHLETKRQELAKLWEISIVQSFLDKKKKISFSTYISWKLFIIHVLILSHISVIF